MDQRAYVPTQAVLLAVLATGSIVVCGHRSGFACACVLFAGALVWIALAVSYGIRIQPQSSEHPAGDSNDEGSGPRRASRRQLRRDEARRRHDRRALASGALGFGVPLAAAIAVWRLPDFTGVLLHSSAAAVGAALVTLAFTAILASSMVDWYLILPWCFGLFKDGVPIWVIDDVEKKLDKDRRRRIGQVWVFHRGLCELIAFTCVALLSAIVLVAVGNALAKDKTIPTAFESLGGAGLAVGIFGYLGPRVRGAMNFLLSGPVGMGWFVEGGVDDLRRELRKAFVVDVSIEPGIKVVDEHGRRGFVPLKYAHHLHQTSSDMDVTWRRRVVEEHLNRDPGKEPKGSILKRSLEWIRKQLRSED